jgi:hypothetical protein
MLFMIDAIRRVRQSLLESNTAIDINQMRQLACVYLLFCISAIMLVLIEFCDENLKGLLTSVDVVYIIL